MAAKLPPFHLHDSLQQGQLLRLVEGEYGRRAVLENADYRWLELDGVVQSVLVRKDPPRLCLPHQQTVAELLPPKLATFLELGLGGGDLTRWLRARNKAIRHYCVELDPIVLELYQEYFQANAKPRLYQAEALAWLEHWQQPVEVALVDLFSGDGVPACLFASRLYARLASCVTQRLIINLPARDDAESQALLDALAEYFVPEGEQKVSGYRNRILWASPR